MFAGPQCNPRRSESFGANADAALREQNMQREHMPCSLTQTTGSRKPVTTTAATTATTSSRIEQRGREVVVTWGNEMGKKGLV
jgi:hypothetical protein